MDSLVQCCLKQFGCGKFILFSHIKNISLTLCYRRACFLTSSLTATIAITLQIPMAIIADVIFKDKTFPLLFYIGSIPMCMALITVAVLVKNEDSDPLLRFFKIIYRKACHCRRVSVVR